MTIQLGKSVVKECAYVFEKGQIICQRCHWVDFRSNTEVSHPFFLLCDRDFLFFHVTQKTPEM